MIQVIVRNSVKGYNIGFFQNPPPAEDINMGNSKGVECVFRGYNKI